jgi:hypothetical protein
LGRKPEGLIKYVVSGSAIDSSGSILTVDWTIIVELFTELDGSTRKTRISPCSPRIQIYEAPTPKKKKKNRHLAMIEIMMLCIELRWK